MWFAIVAAIATTGITTAVALEDPVLTVIVLAGILHVVLGAHRPVTTALMPTLVGTPVKLLACTAVTGLRDGVTFLAGPLLAGLLLVSAGPAAVLYTTAVLHAVGALISARLAVDLTTGADVVDELTTDHREATALLDELLAAGNPEMRRDMADTVITELVRHSVAEEMYVYPAMRKHLPDGEQAVAHDIEEHKDLERTMKELEGCDADDPRFMPLVSELREKLHHRATDEEKFPQLRARLPQQELVKMREQVETAKKIAPSRPHPNAPNSELFHKMVGPAVGLTDRVRNKLTGRPTP